MRSSNSFPVVGLMLCSYLGLLAGCTPADMGTGDDNVNANVDGDGNDNVNGDGADMVVSFSQDVQPIFTARCAGCHSEGGTADVAGIVLRLTEMESYDSAVGQSSELDPALTIVVPGDADASLLVDKISNAQPAVGQMMPLLSSPLSADEIALIRDWVNQGALRN